MSTRSVILIVLACVGTFVLTVLITGTLLFSAVQSAKGAARRSQCTNNLKQIALAMYCYYDQYQVFPPAYTVDKNRKPLHSWRVLLLPYLENAELYERIRRDEPWNSEYNKQFHHVNLPVFQCPSNGQVEPGFNCHYSVVVGKKTPFEGSKPFTFNAIADGLSNTVMCVERRDPVCWMDPSSELTYEEVLENGINPNPSEGLGSFHRSGSNGSGGVNTAFCDGSCRFIPETIDRQILKSILTKDGNESGLQ
ncbi:MAG: DUF1559 domain-containing protein [Planctomycetaceae bacterium]|jgi:prepilin-type processing-associated H-X9-DG protein|nr:DUF1559 domain-containing protein [Planctomycetaceae bacterium]